MLKELIYVTAENRILNKWILAGVIICITLLVRHQSRDHFYNIREEALRKQRKRCACLFAATEPNVLTTYSDVRFHVVLVPACCRTPALLHEVFFFREEVVDVIINHKDLRDRPAGHVLAPAGSHGGQLLASARAGEFKGLRARIPTRWFTHE